MAGTSRDKKHSPVRSVDFDPARVVSRTPSPSSGSVEMKHRAWGLRAETDRGLTDYGIPLGGDGPEGFDELVAAFSRARLSTTISLE
jgi:hypothetical protein